MNSQACVVMLVGSSTEARSLLEVREALLGQGIRVDVWHVGAAGNADAADLLRRRGVPASLYLDSIVRRQLDVSQYSAAILGNDNLPANQLLIESCRHAEIPTFLVQEGVTGDARNFSRSPSDVVTEWPKVWQTLRHYSRVGDIWALVKRTQAAIRGVQAGIRYGEGGADWFFVATEADAIFAMQELTCVSNVEVLGIPNFIPIQAYRPLPRETLGRSSALILTAPFYLAGYGTRQEHERFWTDVVSSLRSQGISELWLRPHPHNEKFSDYAFVGADVRDASTGTLEEAVDNASLCVAVVSTAIVQVSSMGRPTITVDPAGYFELPKTALSLLAGEIGFIANGPQGVGPMAREISPEAAAQRAQRTREIYAACLDGLAAHRIASRIAGVL